jgi:hypothetical protein
MVVTLSRFSSLARSKSLPLCLASLLAIATLSHAGAQQPQSGIDPCSRAIARLATPSVPGASGPADNRLAVSQTVMNFTSCFNRQSWEGVLALTNAGFRNSMFGVSDANQLRDHLTELGRRGLLPQLRIQSIEENGTTGSTLATLVVTWQGWNSVHQELWRLQVENGNWVLAGRSIQSPRVVGVAVGVRFEIAEAEVRSPATQIATPGTVIFAFDNQLDELARVIVLEIAAGTSVDAVVAACNGTERLEHRPAGALQIPAGETISMPLPDLPIGDYAIIVGANPCTLGEPVDARHVQLLRILSAD